MTKTLTENANIDWSEVQKFEALADRWWDKQSEFKPLHDINPLRVDYIKQQLGGQLNGLKMADIGCGGGILAESLSQSGAEVMGIDAGEANIAVAKIHAEQVNSTVDYRQTTVEALAATMPGAFDVVCCMEMLEHVPDPASIISACATLVKPGGKVFFSTINRTPKAYLLAIIGAEYILGMLPKGTHDYAKFLKPDEIDAPAMQADLTIQHAIGMHYNPLTKNYWLDAGMEVNYLVCYQKATQAALVEESRHAG